MANAAPITSELAGGSLGGGRRMGQRTRLMPRRLPPGRVEMQLALGVVDLDLEVAEHVPLLQVVGDGGGLVRGLEPKNSSSPGNSGPKTGMTMAAVRDGRKATSDSSTSRVSFRSGVMSSTM